jgi:hypothetical protein
MSWNSKEEKEQNFVTFNPDKSQVRDNAPTEDITPTGQN